MSRIVLHRLRLALACVLGFVAPALTLLAPVPVLAATIPVTSTLDSGPGTLRQAVLNANPAGGDVIIFSSSVFTSPAGVVLNRTLEISTPLTIDGAIGNPYMPTINGGGISRTLQIDISTTVTLNRVTVTGGNCSDVACTGGGIYSDGALTLTNGSIISNTSGSLGGGLYSDVDGSLYVNNTTFAGNTAGSFGGGLFNATPNAWIGSSLFTNNSTSLYAGAIASNAPFTLVNSTVISNTAPSAGGIESGAPSWIINSVLSGNTATGGSGGGLENDDILRLVGSSVSGNTASVNGGGIFNAGSLTVTNAALIGDHAASGGGGAIYNNNTSLLVTNATFANDTAPTGGGIHNYGFNSFGGSVRVVNSTFISNSATTSGIDVYNNASMNLANTILASSYVLSSTPNNYNCAGVPAIVDGGYNIDAGKSCGFGPLAVTHSMTGTNPLLGPLQINPPGLALLTLALLPGSPAIGAAGVAACPSTDERGVGRPSNHCDIGAYQVVTFSRFVFVPTVFR